MFKINKIETYQIACHCQHIDKISLIEPADPPPFFPILLFYIFLVCSAVYQPAIFYKLPYFEVLTLFTVIWTAQKSGIL